MLPASDFAPSEMKISSSPSDTPSEAYRRATASRRKAYPRSGAYPLDRCRSFEDCERAMADGTMQQLLLPTDSLFTDCPAVALTAEGAERIARGAVVFPRQTDSLPETAGTLCRVYHEGRFLMLGQVRELDKGGLGLFVYKNFR